MFRTKSLLLALLTLLQTAALAQSIDIPLYDGPSGVTCQRFNQFAHLNWTRKGGDWLDRTGAAHGPQAFAVAEIKQQNRIRSVDWNLQPLLEAAIKRRAARLELLLRLAQARPDGTVHFYSREAPERTLRPLLKLRLADGRRLQLEPLADAKLNCNNIDAQGSSAWLSVGPDDTTVLGFDLRRVPSNASVTEATLALYTRETQYGDAVVGAYALQSPLATTLPLQEQGIAASYKGDLDIERDGNVVFAESFDGWFWKRNWSEAGGDFQIVDGRDDFGFEPLQGRALRVRIKQGRDSGGSLRFKLKPKLGREPEEIYLRYYLRFGTDWRAWPEGGKLPGLAGTYNIAGWGDRKTDGYNGWSLRGAFFPAAEPQSPLANLTLLGSYAYHADVDSAYGETWAWSQGTPALLQNGRWYAIEQYVRMNTPGRKDGVLRVWLDGRRVFERSDVRFRHITALRIEEAWMNIFFGGTTPAPKTMHLYLDNVVIATRYIGPAAASSSTSPSAK